MTREMQRLLPTSDRDMANWSPRMDDTYQYMSSLVFASCLVQDCRGREWARARDRRRLGISGTETHAEPGSEYDMSHFRGLASWLLANHTKIYHIEMNKPRIGALSSGIGPPHQLDPVRWVAADHSSRRGQDLLHGWWWWVDVALLRVVHTDPLLLHSPYLGKWHRSNLLRTVRILLLLTVFESDGVRRFAG